MLPRDMSGDELVRLLRRRYGYHVMRQRGSHMRLVSNARDRDHHVLVPRHNPLKVGTLHSILARVAGHLEISQDEVRRKLFDD